MPTEHRRGEPGQALIVAVALLVFLLIVVPALVSLVVRESKDVIRSKEQSAAYDLAEAGIERGLWKLQDDPGYFDLLSSAAIAGYAFDRTYSDLPSTGTPAGAYAVLLSSYSLFADAVSGQTERVITAVGRDALRRETAAVELVVETPAVAHAPLEAQSVGLVGTGVVHWGPIISLSSMSFSGAAIRRYPRKYARGSITAGPSDTDTDPAEPNYDTDSPAPHSEFWSFNEPPGVADPPGVDVPYYRWLAQCSSCAVAAGYPGGGLYYPSSVVVNNAKDTQQTVRFAEGSLKFTGCVATQGVIVAVGSLNFAAGPCNVGQAPPGRYPQTVPIPTSAWMDYRKIDTPAAGEYPGDLGGPGSGGLSPAYVFGGPSGNASTSQTISHFGFVYAASTWGGTGGTVIVGAVLAPNDSGAGSGGVRIYYQDDLNIRGPHGTQYTRVRWERKPGFWPPALP